MLMTYQLTRWIKGYIEPQPTNTIVIEQTLLLHIQ